jgi:hypothetical protein
VPTHTSRSKAFPSREQVRIVIVQRVVPGSYYQFVMQPPYMPHTSKGLTGWQFPAASQGERYQRSICITVACLVSRATRNSHRPCRHLTPSQSILFDEPPPPYTNNSQVVHSLGDAFPQPAVLSSRSSLEPWPDDTLSPGTRATAPQLLVSSAKA